MPVLEHSAAILGLWAVIGYLLGSIPFGMVLARVMGLGNLRDIGSGNIGATNVLRTGNKTAAALTLLLDGGKGVVAVLLARAFGGEDTAQIAALMAMIGHCYPIWLRFAGGKGVATFLGLMLALSLPVGIGCCIAWLVGAFTVRISSMGAIVSSLASLILLPALGAGHALFLGLVLSLILLWRHRGNIARIRAGTEPKIGQKP
ncbi:Glycerol-3-phosphate acyltransferase [Roseobacter fucihabitans]|uniref:Glycerol-3-phosphate acyltransferase n=1 Tax=Roseobacter fucihabitans TaxID=1537242 RepID=A0ABZ2BXB8_9RHOB|nr:glycerol-3-phosphate 1-O-acyltransferase PlsY [Roseobacter litoralis]MBC6967171.1 Glycerol-3-phosphate acyltransferase [Roseobacter litoralis]